MQFIPDVFITGRSFQEEEVKGKTVVVIDILRAASTMVTALHNGARGIIAVEDMGAAGQIARNLDSRSYLLCGEKDAKPVDGYHLGNSPAEYSREVVEDKTLIFISTNGAPALVKSTGAKELIIGSFLNADAVVERLKKSENPVIFVCAGWKSRLSFEDTLCAGYFLYRLLDGVLPDQSPDGACIAFALYEAFGKNITESVLNSNHAKRLRDLGYGDDVALCTQLNTCPVIPVFQDGIFVDASDSV